MRGYFGIGIEHSSKPLNAGNLFRSAHGFGAGFIFTIAALYDRQKVSSDTSGADGQVPFYQFDSVAETTFPEGCRLIGVELLDQAVELPTFKHPAQAAYVLGPERGNLSDELVARCDHVVKIPTQFCINVAMAGAIVMYDRAISIGKFGRRSLSSLHPGGAAPEHVHGAQKIRGAKRP
jgi:tRNA G18 (ribose-2'-O)-methylase SpoU